MQYALLTSSLLFATTVLSATHEVAVGPGLVFSPDSISDVAEGDIIAVTFGSGHDIAQSTFDQPCQAIDNGIYSGPSPNDGDVFSFQVNSTDPMWFYCSVPRHCQGGMALAINPSGENTIDAYKSAARDASTTSPSSDAVTGGTFGALSSGGDSSNSSSSTDSGSSSTTSGSGSGSSSTPSSTTSGSSSGTASSTASGASTSASGNAGAKAVSVGLGLVAAAVAAAL